MTIGIIGSGTIGNALTRRFRAVGHDVTVTNSRGPESLSDLARETGAHAVTLEDAVRGKDVVVVTIPLGRIEDLPPGLFAEAPESLVVIDTCNDYPQQRDGHCKYSYCLAEQIYDELLSEKSQSAAKARAGFQSFHVAHAVARMPSILPAVVDAAGIGSRISVQ